MKKSPNLSVGLVFDDSLDSTDGVAQYVKTLGSWLTNQGHDVTYLVGETKITNWGGGEVVSASKNLKINWGGNNLSMPIWPDSKKLHNVIQTKKFDVLHVQVPYSPLMAQSVIRRAAETTAVIGTFHVYPGNKRSVLGARLLRLLYGHSLGRFDRIVSVSTAAAAFAKESLGIDSSVLPNVVDLSRFRKIKIAKQQKLRIVFLGRLVKRKGCQELLEAYNILHSRLADTELIIAGDGPLRSNLENYVQRHNLGGKVSFLGFVKETDKPALLGSADIACFPSLYGESFGIVLVEAMAAGAGVVLGGDNPGYKTVLGEQPSLLIDPRAKAEFANRLEELLKKNTATIKLHDWQTKTVSQYDVEVVGPQLVAIYHQQIAHRHKKSNN